MWSGVSCGACYSVPPELPLSLFSTCWWGRAAVCKIGNEGAQRTELNYYTTYGQHARILQARNSAPLLITSAPLRWLPLSARSVGGSCSASCSSTLLREYRGPPAPYVRRPAPQRGARSHRAAPPARTRPRRCSRGGPPRTRARRARAPAQSSAPSPVRRPCSRRIAGNAAAAQR